MKRYEGKFPIRQWSEDDKPREKLLLKGKSVLSDAELLAIIIRSGSKNRSAVELSKTILQQVDNDLHQLARYNVNEVMKIPGIGLAKATALIAAMELGRRRKNSGEKKKKCVRSSVDVHGYAKEIFYDLEYEEFWLLVLNRSNEVISKKRISQGGVSGTVADNKLIFKHCLEVLGSSIVVMHNHPSGNIRPSKADEDLTRKIKRASEDLDIQLLDHIIFHNDAFFSFADEGLL